MKTRAETFAPRPARSRVDPAARRYSRFVYRAKLALPALALGLVLLLAAWPRVEGVFENVRLHVPRIDMSDASDLHMVKARYSGIDRENRPFVITADVARQKPNLDDLITLERPKGDLTTTGGNWLELSGDTGFYQPQPQLLDLFGNVSLYQDKGNEFHSTSAHLDMSAGTAVGDDPVTGQGPFGNVTAQGFRILNRGDTIFFTGHTRLDMTPQQGQGR
ncbi:MAG TPA: LPS export ABC transporter periplasmic protein LptC [Stellaceae bacterium]|nr:LPS export ABC transporter periplasmic protein LptC [Stellaceae bacterium]